MRTMSVWGIRIMVHLRECRPGCDAGLCRLLVTPGMEKIRDVLSRDRCETLTNPFDCCEAQAKTRAG